MNSIRRRFFILLLIGLGLGGGLSASAQTTKKSGASPSARSGWSGVVTYTRTQSLTESKTTDRVSGRGKDTRDWEMKFDYKSTVGVTEAPEKNGQSIGKAAITHTFTSTDKTIAVEKNSCDRGKTWQDMTGTFISETKISGQGKEEANVHIGVSADGTYAVSVGIPRIDGTLTGSESSSYSGQCVPKKGKSLTLPPTRATIEGHSLTSDGSHRVNPDTPDQLSGSYTLPLPGGGVETITWSLQKRSGPPLRIVDLKFEHMMYPTWNDWQAITEQTGTVDGNWVKVKATVLNASSETKTGEVDLKETYQGDHWDGARADAPLKNSSFTLTLEAGEAREVEVVWDTSGYAWFDDGRPRLVQRIKAELRENNKKVDEEIRNLKVNPKPIVMVPGIWTPPENFEIYQNLLTTSHSYGWKAAGVVDTSAHGTIAGEGTIKSTPANRTVYDHADNLTTYVNGIRTSLNAWHVDMLAHSTGGLVARMYVHKQMDVLPDGHPVVKHLMLLGTPNKGVPCADSIIHIDAVRENPQTAKELMPEEMALFNQHVTQRKNTKFSALVGNSVPILFCAGPQWNDGLVPVESAKYGIEDVTLTSAIHPAMLSTETFAGYVRAHVITGPQGTYPFATAGN